MFTGTVFAKDTHPGWGFGDSNHIHVGPPGLSVRPINDPSDIPAFIAQIQDFIQKLRLYIFASFFSNQF